MQFVTGSYTGNGVDDRWIDPGFEPDLVIVKGDNYEPAIWRTSVMGSGLSLRFYGTSSSVGNRIQAFGVGGFQVGTDAEVNANGTTYYYAAFRDDGAADFHVGSYTGDGNDNRSITDVAMGFTPTIVWIKRDGGSTGVWRVDENSGDDTLNFTAVANTTNRIQSLIANGFQVGSDSEVNDNLDTYYYVAFCDVANYIETGTYVGDGIDDRDIAVGFEQDLVFLKNADGLDDAFHRIDTMDNLDSSAFGGSLPRTGRIKGFGLTTFMIGDNDDVNGSGENYYWAAWKVGTTGAATTSTSTSTTSTSTSTSSSTTTTLSPWMIQPDGDRSTGWATLGAGATHAARIHDDTEQPTVPDTADNVYNAGALLLTDSYTMETVSLIGGQAVDVVVWLYASVETGQEIDVSLWNGDESAQHGATQTVNGNGGVFAWESVTFAGVNLSQAELDALVVRITSEYV